jgi:hypothetical protein
MFGALVAVSVPHADAQQAFLNGNALFDLMRGPAADRADALGYVTVVIDQGDGIRHPRSGECFKISASAKVTRGQVRDIVLAHLERNPESRHLAAPAVIGAALSGAFPCP